MLFILYILYRLIWKYIYMLLILYILYRLIWKYIYIYIYIYIGCSFYICMCIHTGTETSDAIASEPLHLIRQCWTLSGFSLRNLLPVPRILSWRETCVPLYISKYLSKYVCVGGGLSVSGPITHKAQQIRIDEIRG